VEAHTVDPRDMVFDLRALGEGARGEEGASRDCGKRLDEHGHCIRSFGSPQRSDIAGILDFVAGRLSAARAGQIEVITPAAGGEKPIGQLHRISKQQRTR
jgi:hypothetical protein